MAGFHAQVAADGVHFVGAEVHAQFFKIFQQGTAREFIDMGPQGTDVFLAGSVVFVLDVAHDLFQQVFDGDQARGAAVFIQRDGDVLLAGAEFLQEVADGLGLGHEERFAHDGTGGLVSHLGVQQAAQDILGVEHADHVVPGVAEDRDAGMARLHDDPGHFGQEHVFGDTVDVGAGRHGVLHLQVVEAQDAQEHGLLVGLHFAVGAGFDDGFFQGFIVFASEKAGQTRPDGAIATMTVGTTVQNSLLEGLCLRAAPAPAKACRRAGHGLG